MQPPPHPCRPPFWARGPHAQTLLGFLFPTNVTDPPWTRMKLKLSDGDALGIRLATGRTDVVVYLFHGFGGSADANYIRRAAALFWSQGHTVLAINHRGVGEGKGLARKVCHFGATSDLAAPIKMGRGLFPKHIHIAVGFSLSATILLLLLSRDRACGLAQPDGALAVSPIVDLEQTSLRLERGFNRLYDIHFVYMVRRQAQERWKSGFMKEKLRMPWKTSLRDFDEIYLARHVGFKDRKDYYAQCSCGPYLQQIQVPTVILSALDDPFATARDLEGVELSPSVHLHVEPVGGHLGYFSAGSSGRRWMDYALDYYLGKFAMKPNNDRANSAAGAIPAHINPLIYSNV